MSASALATGQPGMVAHCSSRAAAHRIADAVLASATTGLAVYHDVDSDHALVRATGSTEALAAAMHDGADLGLYDTAERRWMSHRYTWEPPLATPGITVVDFTRARSGLSPSDYHRAWEREHGPRVLAHHLGMWDYTQASVTRTRHGAAIDAMAFTGWARPEDLSDRYTDGPVGAALIAADATRFTDMSTLERHTMIEHIWVEARPTPTGPVVVTDYRQVELDASVELAWSVLGRFGALLDWWPGGFVDCACNSADGIGMTRTLTRADGSLVVERLIDYRPNEHMLQLVIDEGLPPVVQNYTCRYELRPVGPDRCRLDWYPRAVVDADAVGVVAAIVDRGWPLVHTGLTAAVAGRRRGGHRG